MVKKDMKSLNFKPKLEKFSINLRNNMKIISIGKQSMLKEKTLKAFIKIYSNR